MTQRVLILLGCDIDGTESEDVELVSWQANGQSFEMEMCADHRASIFGPLYEHARKVSKQRRSRTLVMRSRDDLTPGQTAWQDKQRRKEENHRIRQWARETGKDIRGNGAIPGRIRVAYEEAMS